MIDEAMGKILGMAMAYGVSGLGMLLAYANYRKRIVKAEKVMSPTAWAVIAAVVLATLGAGWLVSQLAVPAADDTTSVEEAGVIAEAPAVDPTLPTMEPLTPRSGEVGARQRDPWPISGIVVPASIFLLATWMTAALHRHFSRPASTADLPRDERE